MSERLPINVIDELFNAIEIVHGKEHARVYRDFVSAWRQSHKWDCVEWDS